VPVFDWPCFVHGSAAEAAASHHFYTPTRGRARPNEVGPTGHVGRLRASRHWLYVGTSSAYGRDLVSRRSRVELAEAKRDIELGQAVGQRAPDQLLGGIDATFDGPAAHV
jgi:hypothetical protein